MIALALYFVYQIFMPLRHFLYPGDVNWTEEGHRFSWHMKLRDKEGVARFYVTDVTTGEAWEVVALDYLTGWQYEEMVGRPDMILQFSHFIADDLRMYGFEQIEVHVLAQVSLNGRPRQVLIDHTVDLAAQPRTIWHVTWINPLEVPLNP